MEIRGGKPHIGTQYFDGLFWSICTQRSKMKNRTPSFTRTFYSLHFLFECLKNIWVGLSLFVATRKTSEQVKSRLLYLFRAIGLGRSDSQLRRLPWNWLDRSPPPTPPPPLENIGKASIYHTERRNTKRAVRRQLWLCKMGMGRSTKNGFCPLYNMSWFKVLNPRVWTNEDPLL